MIFEVAGHRFVLALNQDLISRGWFKPFEPFQTGDKTVESLFSLSIDTGLPPSLPQGPPLFPDDSAKEFPLMETYHTENGDIYKMAVTHDDKQIFYLQTNHDYTQSTFYLNLPKNADDLYYHKALFEWNIAARMLYSINTAPYNTISIHASAVEMEGEAYLFLGLSGAGKSTHSELWLQHCKDTQLINDDNPVIRLNSDNQPVVYGSPWSGKTPCYKNINYPLGGMAQIIKGPQNLSRPFRTIDAYRMVWKSSATHHWIPRIGNGLYFTCEKIITQVPMIQLQCTISEEAVKVCQKALTKQEFTDENH